MGRRNILFYSCFFLFLSFLSPTGTASDWNGTITSRMDTNGLLENRIRINGPGSELFLRINGDGEGSYYTDAGLRTPFFLAGPVSTEGLLREVERIGRYSARSDVYFDNPGLDFMSGISEKGRYAFSLFHPDGYAGAALILDRLPSARTAAGRGLAWFSVPLCSRFGVRGYADIHSLEKNETGEDSWILDEPVPVSRRLFHTGAGIRAGGKYFMTVFDSFFSLPDRETAGTALRWAGRAELPWLSAFADISAAGPGYMSPGGDFPSSLFHAGSTATLLPDWYCSVTGGYSFTLKRRSFLPEAVIPSMDQREAEVVLRFGSWEGSAGWSYRREWDEEGILSAKEEFNGSVGVSDTGGLGFDLSFSYKRDTEGNRDISLPVKITFSCGSFSGYIQGRCEYSDALHFSGTLRFRVHLRKGSFFVKCSFTQPDSGISFSEPGDLFSAFYLQTGWEVYHSPIKRTSSSRSKP